MQGGSGNSRNSMLKKLKAMENLEKLRNGKMGSDAFDNLQSEFGVGSDGGKSLKVKPLNNFDIFMIANFCCMFFLLCYSCAISIYPRIVKKNKKPKSLSQPRDLYQAQDVSQPADASRSRVDSEDKAARA